MDQQPELIGGREKRVIRLAEYDPDWPSRFARERIRILEALGSTARRVDHIGSTSVPGLAAKPIIDIDVSVPDVEAEDDYLGALLAVGYELRVRQPGHRMVRAPALDVHVHICGVGSDWERRHLLFREWLRRDAGDRQAYADLKRQLARHDWEDMNAYADAKSCLIGQIMARAEEWARAVDWEPCSAE
ncbi:GrpB family protein [Streptomyces sp. NPDC059649]|uniref:GrpB family protein n=1 Tax=Streptomyces sp. NPDC059649 TaxID=3346895 RepID=UPI0036CAF0AA